MIVDKAYFTFLRPLSGVVSPFLGKRSSIVDRTVKPLCFVSHKAICSEAFSTVSIQIVMLSEGGTHSSAVFTGRNCLLALYGDFQLCPDSRSNPGPFIFHFNVPF